MILPKKSYFKWLKRLIPVTMNGTAAATRFRFAESASVQPVVRIPDQGGAFGARYRMSLLFPAVQADHVFYGSFFPVYS